MIYIGSSTHSVSGVYQRLRQYDSMVNVPMYVRTALDDGYKITHKGLLCWAPLPKASARFPLRVLFLALETAFSIVFWAMYSKTKDYGMPKHLCPWQMDAVHHDGCCSHPAIKERVEGEKDTLTAEQIEAKYSQKRQQKSDYLKEFRTKSKADRKHGCNT